MCACVCDSRDSRTGVEERRSSRKDCTGDTKLVTVGEGDVCKESGGGVSCEHE